MNGHPTFRLLPYNRDSGVPGPLPEELFTTGVPEMGPKYRRDTRLRSLAYEGIKPLVGFGLSGPFHRIAIDPATGAIVEVLAKERASGNVNVQGLRQPAASYVNSTLVAFIECVRVAIARFPYYSNEADLREREAVANDLRRLLTPVDPPALEPDRFWSTFVDDVTIGDFSTEDLLESSPEGDVPT